MRTEACPRLYSSPFARTVHASTTKDDKYRLTCTRNELIQAMSSEMHVHSIPLPASTRDIRSPLSSDLVLENVAIQPPTRRSPDLTGRSHHEYSWTTTSAFSNRYRESHRHLITTHQKTLPSRNSSPPHSYRLSASHLADLGLVDGLELDANEFPNWLHWGYLLLIRSFLPVRRGRWERVRGMRRRKRAACDGWCSRRGSRR